MSTNKDNTKQVLRMGFTTIILLLLIVVTYSLYRVDHLTQLLTSVVETNGQKIELASIMHETTNNRWVSLRKMVSTDDPFERDAEQIHFHDMARPFREARDKLFALPLSAEEQNIMRHVDITSREAQPYIRRFVEQLSELGHAPASPTLDEIKYYQNQVMEATQTLTHRVKNEALQAVAGTRAELQQTYIIVAILTLTIILLAIVIAQVVAHHVNKKNISLMNAMQVKSRFLANMSHEIRTPLTAIVGFAEHLLKPGLDHDERQHAANTIIHNGQHLQHIVDEILNLSKDEANELVAVPGEVWLLDLIAEVEETFTQQAAKKGLLFEVHYQPPLPKRIISDPVKLKQILFNLCNNAIKFTEKGMVKLEVSCDLDAQQIYFRVLDNGIGIQPEALGRIFDPFVQADASTTRRFGGTGLGLHLSRRFAELLGGKLEAESQYGLGSCFTLTLPSGAVRSEDIVTDITPATSQLSLLDETQESSRISGQILLAEDTKDNQLLVRAFLKDNDITITSVEDGQQAINAAVQGEFDLILMDIQMPVMNGLQATRVLRDKGWAGPILALTANVLAEDCQRYLESGFTDVIGKPISRRSLLEKISPYLQSYETDDSEAIYSTLLSEGAEFLPAIEHFVQQAQTECQQLSASLAAQNWATLQKQLHRLKGSGGGVGFMEVTRQARAAEQSIKAKDYDRASQHTQQLIDLMQCLRVGPQPAGVATTTA